MSDRDDEIAQLHERIRRLETINAALIDRVERASDLQGGAFSMFETAMSLEALVRERTTELEDALSRLSHANSDLARAHRSADEARARLRDAIESLSDGFALFDADDRLVMCNRAYLRFWPEVAELSDDAQFADVAAAVARNRRTVGSLLSPERWVAERVAHHAIADGIHIQALTDGRWLQINEIRTSEGGTVGIYTDITEVKAEDARERARELAEKSTILQSTLDTIRLGVAVYDSDRRLIARNGPLLATIGLVEDDFEKVRTHAGMVETCRKVNGPFGVEGPLDWLPEGSPEVLSLRRQSSGRVVEVRRAVMPGGGMVMTFEDVTERLQVAEALERRVAERTTELEAEVAERRAMEIQLRSATDAAELANRSKTSFLAAASHDLLQPLNAARLFVAALGERRLAQPTRTLVRQTSVALDSVEELLEALFEISRLDAGAIQPEVGAIDLDRMLAALRIEFAPQAKAAGLILRIPETGFWVRSDFRLLRRILQNFVSNALRYTREGSVEVSVQEQDGHLRLAVRDTGPGIAKGDIEAIFEEFRRLNVQGGPPGKGLGLAIVRRAGAMLGHELEVLSRPGEGAEFAIRVPISPAEPHRRLIARGKGPAMNGADAGEILIIDNDDAVLAGMAELLRNWGYRISTARSPDDDAAQAAIARGVSALIADFHLDDDMLGHDAIAQLRAAAGANLPAAVITADRTEEVKSTLTGQGLPVLHKPVKPAQLRALVRTLTA